jgi:asparagine synthase (glutamine-hydrolysing)
MKDEPALQALTHDTLEKLKTRKIFRPDFIASAVAKHQSGHSGYYGELIWIMVVLELWLESRNL